MERVALEDINLTILRGESIGVASPMGAGKSTLIDLLMGLLAPCGNRILPRTSSGKREAAG
jgi:ATP-binding cassette subfamily B protein RaxB